MLAEASGITVASPNPSLYCLNQMPCAEPISTALSLMPSAAISCCISAVTAVKSHSALAFEEAAIDMASKMAALRAGFIDMSIQSFFRDVRAAITSLKTCLRAFG